MIYLKSLLAGLAAVILVAALIIGGAFVAPLVMERLQPPNEDAIGAWAFAFPALPVAIGAFIVFVAVSYWAFRRASRAQEPPGRP